MIIGIDMGILLTLVAFPPIFILMLLAAVYFLWIPKPAKTYIGAKATKKGVDINSSNIGGLTFRTFKMKGPGILEINKRHEMTVYPRTSEGWGAKVFNADGIATTLSCSDKAVSVNPEMLKIMEINQFITAQKKLPQNSGKEAKDILEEYMKKHPEAITLFKNAKNDYANVPEITGKGKNKKIGFIREVAVLLDPRRLKDYISWNITPGQLLAVDQMAFNDGFEEGQKPILQRLLPLILVLFIGIAIVVLCLAMAGAFK